METSQNILDNGNPLRKWFVNSNFFLTIWKYLTIRDNLKYEITEVLLNGQKCRNAPEP